jgi:hypothetical protein
MVLRYVVDPEQKRMGIAILIDRVDRGIPCLWPGLDFAQRQQHGLR